MRRWVVAIASALAVTAVVTACSPQKVEGSLGEVLDLTFQDVKLRYTGAEVAVSWTRPRGKGEDAVLVVSEHLDGLAVYTGTRVNLAEPLPDFAAEDAGVLTDAGVLPDGGYPQRGLITRDVFNDPRKTFPRISDGYMVLYDVPDGGDVKGYFTVTFARCVDFGCGRTVFGDFKAKVQ